MAWKNAPDLNLAAVLASLFLPVAALAQSSGELLWWVAQPSATVSLQQSPQTRVVTPPFAGEANPYPIFQPAPAVVRPVVPQITPQQQEQMERDRKAKELLREIRSYIASNRAFSPDMQEIKISGYLKGPNGPMVLIKNHWLQENATVAVNLAEQVEFQQMLMRLRSLSPSVYSLVAGEVATVEQDRQDFSLTIHTITPEEVIMKDKHQRTYTIPVE